MMHQHSNEAGEQIQFRNSVYSLFVELAEVTDALTEKTNSNEFDELQSLIQRREECIRHLAELHTVEYGEMVINSVNDGQLIEIVSRVNQSSWRMQSFMEEKNKTIVMALSNLHNQKLYQQ
ncbi:MAG TPA: hypothetical protein DCQ28_13780 [Bacteroidetes bacterium]|nr:hypothetical protein [Bacteroidota bacterium]